jgi:hypothetical protein
MTDLRPAGQSVKPEMGGGRVELEGARGGGGQSVREKKEAEKRKWGKKSKETGNGKKTPFNVTIG